MSGRRLTLLNTYVQVSPTKALFVFTYLSCFLQDLEDWQDMMDLVAKMLIYEPSRRLTMQESVRHAFFAPMKNVQGVYR